MTWTWCQRIITKSTDSSPSWKQVSLQEKAMALIFLRVVLSCCDFCLKNCQVFLINRSEDHVLCLYVYLVFLAEPPSKQSSCGFFFIKQNESVTNNTNCFPRWILESALYWCSCVVLLLTSLLHLIENVMVPVQTTDYIMDVVSSMERQEFAFSLCFRRVLWLQGLRLDNELLVSVIYHQVKTG